MGGDEYRYTDSDMDAMQQHIDDGVHQYEVDMKRAQAENARLRSLLKRARDGLRWVEAGEGTLRSQVDQLIAEIEKEIPDATT
jgi:hypothetical protein